MAKKNCGCGQDPCVTFGAEESGMTELEQLGENGFQYSATYIYPANDGEEGRENLLSIDRRESRDGGFFYRVGEYSYRGYPETSTHGQYAGRWLVDKSEQKLDWEDIAAHSKLWEANYATWDDVINDRPLSEEELESFEAPYAETFESMSWYDPGEDTSNLERAFRREYPRYTLDSSSMEYLIYQGGASNKFHIFFVAQDDGGLYHAFNAYGRIGYNPRIQYIGGPYSTTDSAEYAFKKKMGQKTKKGYRPFGAEWYGAESSDKCSECDGDLEDGLYSTYQCQDCYQDGCELCLEDFCGDCDRCDECCECKCSVCGGSDYQMTETSEGNVCRGCYDYCFACSERRHPKQMVQHELCKPCADDMNSCEACSDYITDTYNERTCVECGDYYCEWCEDNNMTENDDEELVCLNCADSKSKKSAEGSACTVCGDTAVHFYKNGEVVLCDKHYQQRYGKYSAENDIPQMELHNPIETGIKLSIGSMIAVVGVSALGGAVLGLLSRNNGDE